MSFSRTREPVRTDSKKQIASQGYRLKLARTLMQKYNHAYNDDAFCSKHGIIQRKKG